MNISSRDFDYLSSHVYNGVVSFKEFDTSTDLQDH